MVYQKHTSDIHHFKYIFTIHTLTQLQHPGWPAPVLLPSSLLLKAATRALTEPDLAIPALQYAPDPGPLPLRNALSSFLSTFYRSKIPIDRISTTGGASQSFGITLAALTDPGYTRRVWVLQPTYFLAFRIIDDAGLKVEGVEDAKDGIDFSAWEERLKSVEQEAQEEGKLEPVSSDIFTIMNLNTENCNIAL
jgi:DNA-binding transcriptional MocR family regulator